ncbi:MAG: phage tail assembly protein [Lachnospiraceae bacterium]|nr:phage tail assembly protein [Lachnospiraceae bacterium]
MDIRENETGKTTAAATGNEKYIIHLKEPVTFEGKKYDTIDLTGLDRICARDMIAVNRRLSDSGNMDTIQENTLEYALNLAAVAAEMPIEFFEQLKPSVAIRVKRCVVGFIYKQG